MKCPALLRVRFGPNFAFFIVLIIIITIVDFLNYDKSVFPKTWIWNPDPELEVKNLVFTGATDFDPFSDDMDPQDALWQPVLGAERFYVYSAFSEWRMAEDSIRVIGSARMRYPEKVFCRLWLPDGRNYTLTAKIDIILENYKLNFTAVYVMCSLKLSGLRAYETVGGAVSILAMEKPHFPPSNLHYILDTMPRNGTEDNIHVCVKPFHSSYARDEWLVEWFEFHRLLGATHFYMYNKSLTRETECVLKHYHREGLVTLLPWIVPYISKVEIRTENMFAAFNDCLYRSMAHAGWLVVVDTDEVLVPRKEHTLLPLFKDLSKDYLPAKKHPPATFIFRNVFFYGFWENDTETTEPALLTARKTRRRKEPHIPNVRSKYAVRPRYAVMLGNHFIWTHMKDYKAANVHEKRGLSHHYREDCEEVLEPEKCVNVTTVIDRTAHKWSKELVQRVTLQKQRITKDCPT